MSDPHNPYWTPQPPPSGPAGSGPGQHPEHPGSIWANEPTRVLPVGPQPAPAPTPKPRGMGFVFGVLLAALIVGGAAGIGGGAWYYAWQGSSASPSPTGSNAGASITHSSTPIDLTEVEAAAQQVLPSVVKINVFSSRQEGSGSGFILDDAGHIVTNHHVVALGQDVRLVLGFNDGSSAEAEVVGTDPLTDLAVIRIKDDRDLTPARLGSSEQLRVGQPVVAVGSPYGLSATVTSGIVSALNRAVSIESSRPQEDGPFPFDFGDRQRGPAEPNRTTYPAIQTDAAINPGNSGGPLVNLAGEVVGINSSIRTAGFGSAGSIGLGFAIPVDQALPIIQQLIAGETPTHGRLGVRVSDVVEQPYATGALIVEVEKGGPAAKAGLKADDIVIKVNDVVIDGMESLVALIRGHRPDETVTLTVRRGDETITLETTLGNDAVTTDS